MWCSHPCSGDQPSVQKPPCERAVLLGHDISVTGSVGSRVADQAQNFTHNEGKVPTQKTLGKASGNLGIKRGSLCSRGVAWKSTRIVGFSRWDSLCFSLTGSVCAVGLSESQGCTAAVWCCRVSASHSHPVTSSFPDFVIFGEIGSCVCGNWRVHFPGLAWRGGPGCHPPRLQHLWL